jgi:hypothetical protein
MSTDFIPRLQSLLEELNLLPTSDSATKIAQASYELIKNRSENSAAHKIALLHLLMIKYSMDSQKDDCQVQSETLWKDIREVFEKTKQMPDFEDSWSLIYDEILYSKGVLGADLIFLIDEDEAAKNERYQKREQYQEMKRSVLENQKTLDEAIARKLQASKDEEIVREEERRLALEKANNDKIEAANEARRKQQEREDMLTKVHLEMEEERKAAKLLKDQKKKESLSKSKETVKEETVKEETISLPKAEPVKEVKTDSLPKKEEKIISLPGSYIKSKEEENEFAGKSPSKKGKNSSSKF